MLSLPLLPNPCSKGHEDPNWREVKGAGAREEWRLDTRDRKEKSRRWLGARTWKCGRCNEYVQKLLERRKSRISGKKKEKYRTKNATGHRRLGQGSRDPLGYNLHWHLQVIPKSHTLCSCFCKTTGVKPYDWVETKQLWQVLCVRSAFLPCRWLIHIKGNRLVLVVSWPWLTATPAPAAEVHFLPFVAEAGKCVLHDKGAAKQCARERAGRP